MPHPSSWEGWSARSQNVDHGEEGPPDSCISKKGHVTESQSRITNQHIHPLMSHPLCCFRRLLNQNWPLCREDHWHSLGLPFHGWWVWPILSRGCRLAGEHTPGRPIRSYLLGVPASDCLSLPSDREGTISVPNLGHCSDIPTTDLTQALGPTWLLPMDWGALCKCNALYLTNEQ